MLGASNDLVLQGTRQVAEVVAVSRDPHDKIAILFRLRLCGTQGFRRHHIELDMVTVQTEVGADQLGNLVEALISS